MSVTPKLWGEPLAVALASGLAGTRVVSLASIEPDLDPNVHHTNMPFAILAPAGDASHVLAIVEGQKVMIDGPLRTNNGNRYVKTPADLAANQAELATVVAAWVAQPERLGLIDTALAIMKVLKQRGTWWLYLAGFSQGMEGFTTACRDRIRWPAALHLRSVEEGVRLTCGELVRDVRTAADLAEFETREAATLQNQVDWCARYVGEVARAKAAANVAVERVRAALPAHDWTVWASEQMFRLGAEPLAHILVRETMGYGAVFTPVREGVRVTFEGYDHTFADLAAIEAGADALIAAIRAALPTFVTRREQARGPDDR